MKSAIRLPPRSPIAVEKYVLVRDVAACASFYHGRRAATEEIERPSTFGDALAHAVVVIGDARSRIRTVLRVEQISMTRWGRKLVVLQVTARIIGVAGELILVCDRDAQRIRIPSRRTNYRLGSGAVTDVLLIQVA